MQELQSLPSILHVCHPQHQQTTTSPPTQSQHTHSVCQQPIDTPHWQTLLTESLHLSTLLFRLITSSASLNYPQNANQDPSPSTTMACPFCRFLAWLRHKLDVRAQNKAAQARDAARTERIKNHQSFLTPDGGTSHHGPHSLLLETQKLLRPSVPVFRRSQG